MVALAIGFAATRLLPLPSELVPLGGIIAWSGAILDIPVGWQLCDGTNGTPDLQAKFIRCAGGGVAVDDEGGALTHDHAFTGDGHVHANGGTTNTTPAGITEAWAGVNDSASAQAAGDTDSASSLPPFYALAYIQRMV